MPGLVQQFNDSNDSTSFWLGSTNTSTVAIKSLMQLEHETAIGGLPDFGFLHSVPALLLSTCPISSVSASLLFKAGVTVALGLLVVSKVCAFHRRQDRGRFIAAFAAANNCLPTKHQLPNYFLSSLRNKLNLLQSRDGDLLDDVFAAKYRTYGETHGLYDSAGVAKVIHTIDPVNVNVFLSTKSLHYHGPKNRKNIVYPLAQDGMLTTEGAEWAHHRKTVQRLGFKGPKDPTHVETEVELLFQAVGTAEDSTGWTGQVDLLDLFFRLALDTSVQHTFGTSAGSQLLGIRERARATAMNEFNLVPKKESGSEEMTYNEAYTVLRQYISMRSKLGSKYWLADGPKYRRACRVLNDFAENIILQAKKASQDNKDTGSKSTSNFSLVDRLVQEYSDVTQIREAVMDIFIAGQNMSGIVAAWLFAELERQPLMFHQIREEVLDVFGTEAEPKAPMTWDSLRKCVSLQHALYETLRKYPPLPTLSRNAVRDTVLPRGGGPDGSQPIVVPKGAPVTYSLYHMHRREQEWGPNAQEFRPGRWQGRKFGPEYAPFGAGNRICIGQQLSMTELSYLTARIVQRFDRIEAPEGQDNLVKGYAVLVQPKDGVKVRLRAAV